MVKLPLGGPDDQPENDPEWNPFRVPVGEEGGEIWSNFSPILFSFYPRPSNLGIGMPEIDDIAPLGANHSRICWMGSVIPEDSDGFNDEPLATYAATFDGQEWSLYRTNYRPTESLNDFISEAEFEWYELEDLESWNLVEISDSATISVVEFHAELVLELLDLMV